MTACLLYTSKGEGAPGGQMSGQYLQNALGGAHIPAHAHGIAPVSYTHLQGRIIERGSHDELIAKKGKYYQLYTGNLAEN